MWIGRSVVSGARVRGGSLIWGTDRLPIGHLLPLRVARVPTEERHRVRSAVRSPKACGTRACTRARENPSPAHQFPQRTTLRTRRGARWTNVACVAHNTPSQIEASNCEAQSTCVTCMTLTG